jgi:hypothetical protein
MRTMVKVAAWAAVFMACAGVGAFIAAHSNPFPPGVDRPGASPTESVTPTPSVSPAPDEWVGTIRSFTYHQLYVGGRCTTRWRGNLRFSVDDSGAVAGTGAARLLGRLACDFPIAQVQVRRVGLELTGRLQGGRIALHLAQTAIRPAGGHDFGGFGAFLPVRISLAVRDGSAIERIVRRRVDEQGRGVYFWSTGFQLGSVSN